MVYICIVLSLGCVYNTVIHYTGNAYLFFPSVEVRAFFHTYT